MRREEQEVRRGTTPVRRGRGEGGRARERLVI
jgi:hypothetical protein